MNLRLKMSELYDDEGWDDGLCLDFRGLQGTNSYCSEDARRTVLEKLSFHPLKGIHWIDSGDYHYLSEIFLCRVREPFALALFDNHSDEQESAFGDGILSCGNWVGAVKRENPFLKEYRWNEMKPPFCDNLPLYISIDLDVLSTEFARTNWNQGTMTLDALKESLSRIAQGRRILGIDICGGLTAAKGATPADIAVNLGTRRELACFLAQFTGNQSI